MLGRAQSVALEVVGASEVALAPAIVSALTLAVWRLGVDLGWTSQFPVETGLFSHWQVWLAIAAGLVAAARKLRPAQESAESDTAHQIRPVSRSEQGLALRGELGGPLWARVRLSGHHPTSLR